VVAPLKQKDIKLLSSLRQLWEIHFLRAAFVGILSALLAVLFQISLQKSEHFREGLVKLVTS